MTNFKKIVACGAVMAMSVSSLNALAQDDVDDLLKDLEGETAKPAASAVAEAPKAEAAPAEEEEAEPAEAEAAEEKKAEEPAESEAEPAEEAKEEAAPAVAEEKVAEPVKAAAPANDEVKDALNLLDQLAEEAPKAAPAAAAEKAAEKPSAVVAVVVPKKVASPEEEFLSNVAATERLRRDSRDALAQREFEAANARRENREYKEAVDHYVVALKLLNDSAASKQLRADCNAGITECLYLWALQEYDIGSRAEAVKLMERAQARRHPKARRTLEKWTAQSDVDVAKTDFSEVAHRQGDADYKTDREGIRRHLRRSRQYLALRDMARALDECEIVLKTDPYNQEAIRLRRAIQGKRQTILEQERKASRDGMIADVDEAWRPVYAVNAAQLAETSAETVKSQAGEDPERTMEQEIEKRMKEMRLPTIEFKPPATIIEAVEFFRTASRDYDRPDIPIEKRGFNFVLRTPVGAIKQQAQEEASADDFSSNDSGESEATANGLPPIPKITASDISFYDALKLVCDSVDYKFIVRGPIVKIGRAHV